MRNPNMQFQSTGAASKRSGLLAIVLASFSCAAYAQQDTSAGSGSAPMAEQSNNGAQTAAATDSASSQIDPAVIPVQSMQEADEAGPSEPESRQRLDDVVVTATKREKSSREIPVTINAMYGEDLEKQGARDIKDYMALVPGITMQEGGNGEMGDRKISIRGVGPGDLAGQGGNQTVGQFIGDVPMTDPYANFVAPDLDPYDLKTVEILKGPQGTTFGASALNGAIRYVPNNPELGVLGARGFYERLSISEGGAASTYGTAVNAPFGETLAFRGVGVLQHTPGVYDNLQRDILDSDSKRKWSARGMLRWDPTDNSTTVLTYQKQHSHLNDILLADNGDGELVNGDHPGPSSQDISFDLAALDSRYEFDDWGTLVVQVSSQHKHGLTNYDSGTTGPYGLQSLRAYGDYKTKGYTGEVRFVSEDSGNWSWIAGAFMQRYQIDALADLYIANTAGLDSLPGLPAVLVTPRGLSAAQAYVEPTSKESSLYGEVVRKLGERWDVALGARFYNTELHGYRNVEGLISAAYPTGSYTPIEQNEKGISPKLSVTFKPTDGIFTYATVSRGFQFGGANPPPTLALPNNNPVTGVPVPVDFKSSVLWNYEVGVRTDWFERTLRIDTTAFFLDWSKAQFGQSSGGALPNNYTDNVGKVHSRGMEATIAWLTPVPGLSLNLAGSYIVATTAAPYDPGTGDMIPPGTTMPATPRVQTAATLQYNLSLGPWLTNASLTHTHWGKAYNNIQHTYEIYDFENLNGLLSVSRPDWSGAPTLAFGIANIADERALMSHIPSSTAIQEGWAYSRPRAISLRLSADFN